MNATDTQTVTVPASARDAWDIDEAARREVEQADERSTRFLEARLAEKRQACTVPLAWAA